MNPETPKKKLHHALAELLSDWRSCDKIMQMFERVKGELKLEKTARTHAEVLAKEYHKRAVAAEDALERVSANVIADPERLAAFNAKIDALNEELRLHSSVANLASSIVATAHAAYFEAARIEKDRKRASR